MQRNLILFITLSALILSAWFYLATSTPSKKKDLVPKGVAQNKNTVDKKPEEQKAPPKNAEPPKVAPKKAEPKKEEPLITETLGGAGFHLTADLISRGAGVRKLTLNEFKAADWLGRPTDRVLELIQDDQFSASYRMYNFIDPKDDPDNRPVFGLGEINWKLEKKLDITRDEAGNVLSHEVQFSTFVPEMDHIKIVRTFRLAPRDYHITLVQEIHDERDPKGPDVKEILFRYQMTGAQGLPIEGEWYTSTFRNSMIGLVDTHDRLWRKMEDSARIGIRHGGDRYPDGPLGDNRMQYAGAVNQFFAAVTVVDNEQPKEYGADKGKILAWARPTMETAEKKGVLIKKPMKKEDDEILFRDDKGNLLTFALLPRTRRHIEDLGLEEGQKVVLSTYETPEPEKKKIASWIRLGETLRPQFDDFTMRVNSEVIPLTPGVKKVHKFMLYHGPVKVALLRQFTGEQEVPDELVTRYTETLHLNTLTDYRSDNWLSEYIFSPIGLTFVIIKVTGFMHFILYYLQFAFGYGLSIVVLTVMVRGAMFPISRRQAMFSRKMQELAPELKKIKEKYADDPRAQMQATRELQSKHGISTLGSCWPLFLQMPIFLGLYFALQESIHFRLAEFLWIKNLAAPDMLLYWGGVPVLGSLISSPDHSTGFLSIFYLGPYLNALPIVAGVLMLVQQMQTMPPATDEQQEMQQKMMKYMTIVFGLMFFKVAAGMCIYFISSSLWGCAERKLLPKKKPGTGSVGVALAPPNPVKPSPYARGKGKPEKKEKADENAIDKVKAWWKEVLRQAEKK